MLLKKIVLFSVIPVIIFIVYFFSDNANESLTNTKVLFIGNSYTYRNNMPHIFEEISKSKGEKVEVEHCTLGKATLYIQSKRPKQGCQLLLPLHTLLLLYFFSTV